MKLIKRIVIKVFFALSKIFLPKKYFDVIYISELLQSKKLNRPELRKRIWCFLHGFLPYEYVWYDLANNDYKSYVPARNNYQKRLLNGSFNAILANKLLFENHIKTIISGIDKLHVVESIGFIEDGYLQPLHKNIIPGEFSSLIPFLKYNDLILKPTIGDGGIGISIIRKDNDHFLLNNKKVVWEELVSTLNNLKHCLIQEKFVQKGFSNEIYSGSVNTMRIATMIDPVTQKPFIAYAVHRFGSFRSNFMDNINQGGITAMIDLIDGKLSKGFSFSFKGGEKEIYELHPQSLKSIYNEQIPNWDNLKNRLIEMARRMPYLKYVGWDIILSDDELFVLEGNVSPGLGLIQTHKPLKDFPSAWNFFKHYGYIE